MKTMPSHAEIPALGRTVPRVLPPMTIRVAIALVLLLGCDQPIESEPESARPAAMHLTPREAELSALGSTIRLIAEVRDQYGQVMPPEVVNWSSDSPRVASVDASGLVTAIANGTALVQASAGTVSRSAKVAVAQVTAKLVLEPHLDTLLVGDTLRLAAAAFDANGHVIPWAAITWTSQDPRIAVVDASGLVTAVAEGTVGVEASTASGVTGRVEMEVVPPVPTVVTVIPDSVVFTALGNSEQLSAEVCDQAGRLMEGVAVVWSSGDTAVAGVDRVGRLTAAGEGETVLTADAGGATATAVVRVDQMAVAVVVTPPVDTVAPGDTLRLVAEALDANGHRILRLANAFAWTSSDAAVVRVVEPSGLVTGASEGTATIIATLAGGSGASAEIAVVNPDKAALVALYEATGGPEWDRRDNWLTNAPLGDWYGVWENELGRVTVLSLYRNGLTGEIPAELGNLTSLEFLDLGDNALTGSIPLELGQLEALRQLVLSPTYLSGEIPAEMGNLAALKRLSLGGTLTGEIPAELGNLAALEFLALRGSLTGEIPAELGNLAALETLYLTDNELSGEIPAELGNLAALKYLSLADNTLTGEIPPELGYLAALRNLRLSGNGLTGEIPKQLGQLIALEGLYLTDNALIGEIPPELGNLAALRYLWLSGNISLAGALPPTLTHLRSLVQLEARDTGLCAPHYPTFVSWVATRPSVFNGPVWCPDGAATAYLVQAVQSRGHPVPLVAERDAILRVFLTAPARGNAPVPPVLARFYAGAEEVYSVEIPAKPGPLVADTVIDEGELAVSANVRIPGSLLRPGLKMVVETEADPWFGIPPRWPVEGTASLDVRAVPTMELTVVPFLWTEDPDSSVVAAVQDMAADPEGHEVLRRSRALLPASDWSVTAHEPVWTDIRPTFDNGSVILSRTGAIRALEGGRGYWMGTIAGGGRAWIGGWTSVSGLWGPTIAHELGHNMSLWHAPCGNPLYVDAAFPDRSGKIGAWGYSLDGEDTERWSGFAADEVVPPHTPDVMSYCGPRWISGYHFRNALDHRLRVEASAPAARRGPIRTLMLWGGTNAATGPYLESAFVVDAAPVLPDSAGGYTLAGWDAGGRALFSVSFAMPVVADAEEGAGGFVYTLPARPGWEALTSVTLSAPDGRTAVLDGATDRPMTILRDAATGRVRAFLDGTESAANAGASGRLELAAELGTVAITSRGIPDAQAWRR